MDLAKVGDTLSILLAGNVVTTWEAPDGESYSVKLRVPKPARRQELLDVLTVSGRPESNGLSNMIPLSSLIDFTEGVSPPPNHLIQHDARDHSPCKYCGSRRLYGLC